MIDATIVRKCSLVEAHALAIVWQATFLETLAEIPDGADSTNTMDAAALATAISE